MLSRRYLQLSLAIIGLAILISVLIIRKPASQSTETSANLPFQSSSDISAKDFNLEINNQKLTADIENLETPDENNLTLKLANELAQQILQLNENNDLSSGELQVPNEELFSEAMIEKYKSYFLKNLPFEN